MAAGVHLRAIQQEMDHDSPKTTAVYTQLTEPAAYLMGSDPLCHGL
jgi:site-specific recombinase XerD